MNTLLSQVSSDMEEIIHLYELSRSTNDTQYEQNAGDLLEEALDKLSYDMPVKLGDGLLGMACGIIYLLQHHYIEGDADEILSDIDQILFGQLAYYPDETVTCWIDWLYYFRIRILCERKSDEELSEIVFRQNMIFLLDRLTGAVKKGYVLSKKELHEIEQIHQMNIFPVQTASLLGLKIKFPSISIEPVDKAEITFIIPVRIDSKERELNLDFVLERLVRVPDSQVWIIEGDSQPRYCLKHSYPNIHYFFVEDSDVIFYRTKYLNDLLMKVDSPIVGIWDADICVSNEQIQSAVCSIKENGSVMSFPYDGHCCNLSSEDSRRLRVDPFCGIQSSGRVFSVNTYGGAFFVNRKTYLMTGGENESFYGWGPEDMERIKRLEILGLPVFRAQGALYHLYHPRGKNSGYAYKDIETHNRKTFLEICGFSPEELWRSIQEKKEVEKLMSVLRKSKKYKEEAAFWKREILLYQMWYKGELSQLYNTPAPLPDQCVVAENLLRSSILTWTNLHQCPKYLHELQLPSLAFEGKRVLDVGAGPIPSATCFSGCDLYALDPLLSIYRELGFPHDLYPNVHFVEAHAEQLPFDDNFFDVILSVNAIDHIDDLVQAGKELERVSKPDCFFAMHVHYHPSTVCEPVEITDSLFKKVFGWVKGLHVVSRLQHSYTSVVPKGEQFVLWSNRMPDMEKVIRLYTDARCTGNNKYADQADKLLDTIIETTAARLDDGYAICRLGCGLIRLLRNGFVEGNEDDVLSDIDWRLTTYVMNRPGDLGLLYGWIHYLTLRIDREGAESWQFLNDLNKQNLICLLDYLKKDSLQTDTLSDDIKKIDALDLYPERTKRLLNKDACVVDFSICLGKIENRNVTFVIPVRIDSPERSENLDMVLRQLSHRERASVLILEADVKPLYNLKKEYSNVKYLFVEDHDPVFHRTKYLNWLLRKVETELVGIWDTDVILSDIQIDRALQDICEGKAVMSYPYDGRFYLCTPNESTIYRQEGSIDYLFKLEYSDNSNFVSNSVGGAFLVRKDLYLEAGGENEFFYGWGLEDQERIRRLFILGLPVTRADGPLFHLFHPRNENSRYKDYEAEGKSLHEFLKVCSMTSKNLRHYIQSWISNNQ